MKQILLLFTALFISCSTIQQATISSRKAIADGVEVIEMNYTVDESLLGGMVIRMGDRVVDTSIKNKLRELSKQLSALQVG